MSAVSSSSASAGSPALPLRLPAAERAGVCESARVEQAHQHGPDRRLGASRCALATRLDQRDGPLLADEDGLRVDLTAARVRVLCDLEDEIACQLRSERDASSANDREDLFERDRRIERAGAGHAARSASSTRRTGTPHRASARFASATVQVPSWKMVAASTALARPSIRPGAKMVGRTDAPARNDGHGDGVGHGAREGEVVP